MREGDHQASARRFFEALSSHDLDAIDALIADRVEYRNPDDAIVPGTRRGRQEFLRAMQAVWDSFEGYAIELEELDPTPSGVVAVGRPSGLGRGSGAPFEDRHGYLLEFGENGLVTSLEWFRDPDRTREAAGARLRAGETSPDLRELQRPLKERYRSDPEASRITLRARASEQDSPMACSVEAGRAIQEAQAHVGAGGPGTAACSGDLLLGALAACAQVTCQMVAAATGIDTEGIEVHVEGDLDLSGTLGVSRQAPVGFEAIRMRFEIDAPGAGEDELASLIEKTERYCTVLQTLREPPPVDSARV